MKVSIIMPVYNAAPYLNQCIDSLLGQTLDDFELLVINDGSTDGSLAILESYQKKDKRVKVVTQQNQYAGAARNRGLSMAKGDYIVFLDGDDFFDEDMLATQYKQITKTDADLCCCMGEYYHNDTGERTPWRCLTPHLTPKREVFRARDLREDAFRFTFSGPTNKMYRRAFLEKHNLRYQTIRSTEDMYYICMTIALAERITVTCQKPLLVYRVGLKTNAQSLLHCSPLDNAVAGTAFKEGLIQAGLYPLMKPGFDNFIGFEFERWCARLSAYPEAFCEVAKWYKDIGKDIYDIDMDSLDPGTLSNWLMTFEGVHLDMDAEEARLKILSNKNRYQHLYANHQKERFIFLCKKLANMKGPVRGSVQIMKLVLRDIRKKWRNRK